MRHLVMHAVPPEMLERIKAIKPRVTDEPVQPHRAEPGSPGPILSYGAMPPFACEYAVITERTTDEGLEAALKHCLRIEQSPKGGTMAGWFSKTLGVQVTEVFEDEGKRVPAFV